MQQLLTVIAPYRKFIVPAVALAVVVVGQVFGVDSRVYVDLTMLASALGVLAAKNDQPASPPATPPTS